MIASIITAQLNQPTPPIHLAPLQRSPLNALHPTLSPVVSQPGLGTSPILPAPPIRDRHVHVPPLDVSVTRPDGTIASTSPTSSTQP